MKYGLNMLLWTSDVNESHFGLLEQIKGWGYDGIELPVFEADEKKFSQVGKKLSELGLGCTAVTVCTPEENPISSDAKIREAGPAGTHPLPAPGDPHLRCRLPR